MMIEKTRALRAVSLAAFLGLALAVSAPSQTPTPEQKYAALVGTWDAQTENASYTFIFEFSIKDGMLQGKYTGSAGTTDMENLKFENNLLSFSVNVNGMALDYSAVIDGDKLSGQVTLQYGQADISGKKREK
jgi:hypothetical protein